MNLTGLNQINLVDQITAIHDFRCDKLCSLALNNVNFSFNHHYIGKNAFPYDFIFGILSVSAICETINVDFNQVTVMSNIYYRKRGGVVLVVIPV